MAYDESMDEPELDPAAPKPVDDEWKSGKKLIKVQLRGKTRREYGRKNRNKKEKGIHKTDFILLGSSANGIKAKRDSIQENLNHFQPSVITLQKMKRRIPGTIKIKGYQIFENLRSGGILTAVDENLQPVLI